MTEYILVPLDGSTLAESVLPMDVALAHLTSSGITLLRAVPAPASRDDSSQALPPTNDEGDSLSSFVVRRSSGEERATARDYLDKVGERLEEGGLQVRTEIVEESPAAAIAEYAEENADVRLISMATRHSPSGSWPSGSVAERVLHMAHKPILLIRPSDQARTPQDAGHFVPEEAGAPLLTEPSLHMIVVPLDGSRFAEEALEQAKELALLQGATVALVCAIPPSDNRGMEQMEFIRISADFARESETVRLARYLSETAEQLRAEGLDVLTELAYGHPAETILRAAVRLRGDLIVLAAQGRRDFERLWLGSVAQKLVQSSTLPVLVMRKPKISPEIGSHKRGVRSEETGDPLLTPNL